MVVDLRGKNMSHKVRQGTQRDLGFSQMGTDLKDWAKALLNIRHIFLPPAEAGGNS